MWSRISVSPFAIALPIASVRSSQYAPRPTFPFLSATALDAVPKLLQTQICQFSLSPIFAQIEFVLSLLARSVLLPAYKSFEIAGALVGLQLLSFGRHKIRLLKIPNVGWRRLYDDRHFCHGLAFSKTRSYTNGAKDHTSRRELGACRVLQMAYSCQKPTKIATSGNSRSGYEWRRRESNPRPVIFPQRRLHA